MYYILYIYHSHMACVSPQAKLVWSTLIQSMTTPMPLLPSLRASTSFGQYEIILLGDSFYHLKTPTGILLAGCMSKPQYWDPDGRDQVFLASFQQKMSWKELASHRASVDMVPVKQFAVEMSRPVSSFSSLKHASASWNTLHSYSIKYKKPLHLIPADSLLPMHQITISDKSPNVFQVTNKESNSHPEIHKFFAPNSLTFGWNW